MLAFAMVTMYANRLLVRSGSFVVIIAIYSAKHWVHVARSGIIFLVPETSSARTTMMCPSSWLDRGRVRPFAGGSSEKSMYCPARICSTSFRGTAGNPAPTDTIFPAATFGWVCDPADLASCASVLLASPPPDDWLDESKSGRPSSRLEAGNWPISTSAG